MPSSDQREALYGFAELLSPRGTLAELFTRFCERLGRSVRFDAAQLFAYETDRRFVRVAATYPEAIGPALPGKVFRAAPLGVDELEQHPEGQEYDADETTKWVGVGELARSGFRHGWVIPLVADATAYGFFHLARRSEEPFAIEELALLRTVAPHLAAAVRRDTELAAARQAAARAAILNELALLLNAGEPIESLSERLFELLERAIAFDYVGLFIAGTEPGTLRQIMARPRAFWRDGHVTTYAEVGFDGLLNLEGSYFEYRVDRVPEVTRHFQAWGIARAATVVMRLAGEPLGMLSVGRRRNVALTAEDATFLETAARLLSEAIANQQRIEQIERSASRARVLNEIALLVNSGESPGAFFGELTARMEQALVFDHFSLLVDSADHKRLVTLGSITNGAEDGPLEFDVGSMPLSPEEAKAAEGVLQAEPGLFDAPSLRYLQRLGIERLMSVILRDAEGPVGVLNIGRVTRTRFGDGEEQFFRVVGTLVGQAVVRQRHLEHVQAEAARSELLRELSFLLNAGEPVETLFNRLPALLQRAVAFDYAGIAVMSATDERLRATDWNLLTGTGVQERWVTRKRLQWDRLTQMAEPVVQFRPKRTADTIEEGFVDQGLQRSAILVLSDPDGPVGLLHLARQDSRRFTPDEMGFLDVVATLLAQSIGNQLRIERSAAESEEQRIMAEAARTVMDEPDRFRLAPAFGRILAPIVPGASVAFTYLEGGRLVHDRAPGETLVTIAGRFTGEVISQLQVTVHRETRSALAELSPGLMPLGAATLCATASVAAGTATGILTVATRRRGYRFSERAQRILRLVAQVAGPAMLNARNAELRAAEEREREILAEVTAITARESEAHSLIRALAAPLGRVVPSPVVTFGYIENGHVRFRTADREERIESHGVMTARALEEGQAVLGAAGSSGPPTVVRELERAGARANSLTLCQSGWAIVGLLFVGSKDAGYQFKEADLALLRKAAAIIAPAMDAARAARRAAHEAEEQRLLAEVASAAARESSPAALLAAVTQPLARFVPAPLIVYSHIEDGAAFYTDGESEHEWPLLPIQRRAIEYGQAVHLDADGPYPEEHPAAGAAGNTAVVTAAYAGGTVAGLLNIASREADFRPGARHLRLFQVIAQTVGAAMESLRASVASARESKLYGLMFDALTEAVVLLDQDLQPAVLNHAGAAIVDLFNPARVRLTMEETLNRIHPGAREALQSAAKDGITTRFRIPLVLEEQRRWFDFELVPLTDTRYRVLAVATDVTDAVRRGEEERQHREQMEHAARLAALGEIIGGVAHELNNPLTAILGFAEVLALSQGSESITEELGIIQKEALRARNIVRDLLFIARPGQSERTKVQVRDVLAHVERLRRSAWQQQGIDVTLENIETDCVTWGNETQLTQTVLNLVTNAEDAVRQSAQKRIQLRCACAPGGGVAIEVADSGEGMDKTTAGRIFEPFFTTKQGRGTGLGLSLSHSIVRAHEGTIEVDSRRGEGTTFRITLPGRPDAASGRAAEAAEQSRRSRVLVIDDEPSLRDVCQRLVTSMGHDCAVAENSGQAVALATEHDYDLLLCDYRLAGETADRIVEALHGQKPQLIERIVIATGATTDPGVVELTERFGLQLIAKPYGTEDIARLIAQAGRAS